MEKNSWNQVFTYIEQHVYEEELLEKVATIVGYSPTHFHHLFTEYTEKTFGSYVRNRRIVHASRLLTHTNQSILTIAFLSGFQSQEAFSRVFKQYYQMPPAVFRKQNNKTVKKESIKMSIIDIPNWIVSGNNFDKFLVKIDNQIVHSGTQSINLLSKDDVEQLPGDFITVMQQFSAQNYLGKRVRVRAYVKTELTTGWGNIWIRIDGQNMEQLGFDNMLNRPINGVTEWQPYDCIVDVPENAKIINIGSLIEGQGSIWVDDFSFEEVDISFATTDDLFPKFPSNLSFEMKK